LKEGPLLPQDEDLAVAFRSTAVGHMQLEYDLKGARVIWMGREISSIFLHAWFIAM